MALTPCLSVLNGAISSSLAVRRLLILHQLRMPNKDTFDTGTLTATYCQATGRGQVSESDTVSETWHDVLRYISQLHCETLVVNGILFALLLVGLMVSL
ncbi:hypothetical protein AOLI_G00097530 [Acnodon oligacanthus]